MKTSRHTLKSDIFTYDDVLNGEVKFTWRNLYPNNIMANGIEGKYAIVNLKDDEGKYSATQYIVLYEVYTDEDNVVLKNLGIKGYRVYVRAMTKRHKEPFEFLEPVGTNGLDDINEYDIVDRDDRDSVTAFDMYGYYSKGKPCGMDFYVRNCDSEYEAMELCKKYFVKESELFAKYSRKRNEK